MLRKLLLTVFLGFASPVLAADADLRDRMTTILADEGLAGAAWALVTPVEGLQTDVAGFRNLPAREPFATDTRFHVGSIAKAVLATGVLRLASDGRIDLDAPVVRYLPDLAFANPWASETPVTVRHLLDHTAGLDDARLWQMFSERARPDSPLASAFGDAGRLLRVRSRPGTRFSYSNMGYGLLGLLVERVTGERYETWLDRTLLAPLGMADSTFAFTSQAGEGADPDLAWGHVDDGSRYAAAPMHLRPAGQFTTTIGDLGRFARFIMGDGRVGGVPLIADHLMRARGKPVGTEAARAGLEAGYALGLGRRDRHGVVGFCHGGNIVGFAAMLCVFPDEQKAFAYAVNTDSETAEYGKLAAALIDALALDDAEAPATHDTTTADDDWQGYYRPSPNRFATFRYLDELFGVARLERTGPTLAFMPFGGAARELRPTGPRLYAAADRATTSHALIIGEDGERLVSDGFGTLQRISATSVVLLWASLLAGLCGCVWFLGVGVTSLLRRRGGRRHPALPAALGVASLLIPVPLFFTQSFMALGDATPASVLLAVATLALPLGALVTLLRAARDQPRHPLRRTHAVFAVAVLQWCVVLAVYGLLPFALWR